MKTGIVVWSAAVAALLAGCAATRTVETDNVKVDSTRAEYRKLVSRVARNIELTADSPRVVVEYVDSPSRRVTVTARRVVMSDATVAAADVEEVAVGQSSLNKQTRTSGTRRSDRTLVWVSVVLVVLLLLAMRRRGQHS